MVNVSGARNSARDSMDDSRSNQTSYHKRARLDESDKVCAPFTTPHSEVPSALPNEFSWQGHESHSVHMAGEFEISQTPAEVQDELLRMIEEGIRPTPSFLFELPDAGLPPQHSYVPDAPMWPVLGHAATAEAVAHPPSSFYGYLHGTDGCDGLPSILSDTDVPAVGTIYSAVNPFAPAMAENLPVLQGEHQALRNAAPSGLEPGSVTTQELPIWWPTYGEGEIYLDRSATGSDFGDVVDYLETAQPRASGDMSHVETMAGNAVDALQPLLADISRTGSIGCLNDFGFADNTSSAELPSIPSSPAFLASGHALDRVLMLDEGDESPWGTSSEEASHSEKPAVSGVVGQGLDQQTADKEKSAGFTRKLLEITRDLVYGACDRLLPDTYDAVPISTMTPTSRTSAPISTDSSFTTTTTTTTAAAAAASERTAPPTVTSTVTATITVTITSASAAADVVGPGTTTTTRTVATSAVVADEDAGTATLTL
ncbi:uncharacterized protein B0H18DRAFT_1123801 [Fomitopsis serialis]|uniref:uncharacterized protein n=1 Tax=Fomitopsis serialis TaxID=139415 RepID=UPI0020086D8E|nr:uncharacterized protein B0H18DRAFT_1123801 [Neoantrodia serialis]KAH9917209.1 hypothetical protein B0H18DRAFT_1123801 [Neoantrodia serialis]